MRQYPFYFISTPIGNLEDMPSRGIAVLREADFLLAEDTRKARVLLGRYGIEARPRPFHDHNKEKAAPAVIAELKAGKTGALVTDAGTPGISDPGFYLVRMLVEEGIEYTVIPGPSAVTTALLLSGFPPDRFTFYGYLPRKKGAREKLISEAMDSTGTSIFFESPFRLVGTLEAMAAVLGEREVAVAREMTKVHEEIRRGTAAELAAYFSRGRVRGEITLLVRGKGRRQSR